MRKIFFILLCLFTACFSETEKENNNNESVDSKSTSAEDDSVYYATIDLYGISIDNPNYKKIYDKLNNLSFVKTFLQDSAKHYDTISFEIINGRIINDSLVKLPTDCLKVELVGYYNKDRTIGFYTFTYILKNDSILVKDWNKIRSELTAPNNN